MLFEWSWVGKVPSDAVKSTEDDAEESEDDHAGVLVTLRGWCIEGRDVFGTRSYGAGSDDAEDGCEDKGDEDQEGEEGEKQDGGCEQEEEQTREDEEPTHEEARYRRDIKKLP